MNTEILESIGLTKSEIKVYLALLELGSSATGKIVDKSKVASSKVYEILDKLMQKGMASFIIQSGVKYFEAASPSRIMDYMNEKEKKFEKQKHELKNLLPQLELKQKISKYKSEATIYKGYKGVETAFYSALDLLKSNDEMLVIGIPSRSETLNRFFVKFSNERGSRKIKERRIVNESAKKEEQNLLKNVPLSAIKFMPETTPASINIFKNRVLIFPESREPLLISIDNKEISESFRVQFEILWNQETRVVKGLDAIQEIFEEILASGQCDFIGAKGCFIDSRQKFIDDWEKRAIKSGFKMRNIVDKSTKGHRITKFSFAKTKYSLQKEFANLSVFWIYGNKVVISNWVEKEPTVIIIENKNLYNMHKKQFELLWKKPHKTLK